MKNNSQLANAGSRYILVIFSPFIFSSCEKVVMIDLNSVNPKLVVEANITNEPGPYTVKLSHTINYYDPNVFPTVSGALVTISDNAGNVDTLTEVSPGEYHTSTMTGTEGRTYILNIFADGQSYAAISTMPYGVPIDSLNYTLNSTGNFPSYRVVCKFTDPISTLNYYKLHLSSNDTLAFISDDRLLSDKFTNGQEMSITRGRAHLLVNDTIFASLESISKATYDYYTTIVDVQGGIRQFMSAPPANPITNISNGGLGYFNAMAVSRDTTIIY